MQRRLPSRESAESLGDPFFGTGRQALRPFLEPHEHAVSGCDWLRPMNMLRVVAPVKSLKPAWMTKPNLLHPTSIANSISKTAKNHQSWQCN